MLLDKTRKKRKQHHRLRPGGNHKYTVRWERRLADGLEQDGLLFGRVYAVETGACDHTPKMGGSESPLPPGRAAPEAPALPGVGEGGVPGFIEPLL